MHNEMTTHDQAGAELDQSAVAAVRGGDAERYRELVERHGRLVYAVAWSRLGNATLAEEVAQETFIRAYRRLWLLGDGAKFAAWISTIARRLAVNFGLRHRSELNRCERWALENVSETAPDQGADETGSVCTPETLRQTLAELPDNHRECLVLFYLEGKSGAEAAAALGISEAALRVRLHRARAALRERLATKLEDSLTRLRPSKTLVPAVMAGVLASQPAKAGLGAALMGAFAKIGLAKCLWALGSFFSFLFVLPMLLATWLLAQLELKNFRDQKGFRARLFRRQIKDRLLLVITCAVLGLIVIRLMRVVVEAHHFAGLDPKIIIWLATAFSILCLPLSARQLAINRNPFFIVSVSAVLVSGIVFLLVGLNLFPPLWINLVIFGQAALTLPFYKHRPIRMDYNLFIRAAENLLPPATVRSELRPRSKPELLTFGRFLGTRWLANHFAWTKQGLTLRLPPVGFSQWNSWTDLMFNRGWRNRSTLNLGYDGSITTELGAKDLRTLELAGIGEQPNRCEWSARVAAATAAAWHAYDAGDIAAAERALGQIDEQEVFVTPPARGGMARVRWLFVIILVFCILGTFGIRLPYFHLKPSSLIPAQVQQSSSPVNTNPLPIINRSGDNSDRQAVPNAVPLIGR